MIDVIDVTHHYGLRPVLKRVSLRVETGEVVALMGPNGMGKTTLLGVMAGAIAPVRGHVEIGGVPFARCEWRQFRGGLDEPGDRSELTSTFRCALADRAGR